VKQTSVREHRKFNETFKREAVLNWLHRGKSAAVVCEELGINANLLYAWRKLVDKVAGARVARAKSGSLMRPT
jgi:transposase-like protein